MAHAHGPHESGRAASRRALAITLALTTSYTLAEVVGGLLTGSLALLADAAHMLSDDLSLGLALFAVWLAQKPPSTERTFGYKRAEILAALANGVTLVAISIWIFFEAYRRLEDPPEILGGWMLVVAIGGLLVNAAALIASPPAAIASIGPASTSGTSWKRSIASTKIQIEIATSVRPLNSATRISAR